MDRTPVRRCICCAVTFEELKAHGVRTLEEVRAIHGCTTKCGSCLPYVERMLETGETAFAPFEGPYIGSCPGSPRPSDRVE